MRAVLCRRYRHIERKLQLSRFLHWTFVSCEGVMQVGAGHSRQVGGAIIMHATHAL